MRIHEGHSVHDGVMHTVREMQLNNMQSNMQNNIRSGHQCPPAPAPRRPAPTSTPITAAVLRPMGLGRCGERVASTPMRPPLRRGTWILALSPERSGDRYLARSVRHGRARRGRDCAPNVCLHGTCVWHRMALFGNGEGIQGR